MHFHFSRRTVHALICGCVFVALAAIYRLEEAGYGNRLTSWEYRFRDAITVSGRFEPPDARLAFLGIDSSSVNFSQLDLETIAAGLSAGSPEARALNLIALGWPWSREVYGLLAERLLAAGARGVAFDLLLPKPGPGDDFFRAVIQRHPKQIVIGANFTSSVIGPGEEAWSLDLPTRTVVADLAPASPSIGYVNFWPDFNGVVRSAYFWSTVDQLQGAHPPPAVTPEIPAALSTRAARWFGLTTLANPFRPHLIRWSGPPGTFVAIPVYQVFVPAYWERNFGSGSLIRDKVVVVGPAGDWAHDEHPTPFGEMPGPEIHLQSINALIHHAFLRAWPPWAMYLLIALGSFAAWLLTALVMKIWLRLAAFVAGAAAFLYAIKLAYDYASAIVPGIPPVLAFAVSGLVSFIYDYTRETLEKLRVRRTLESYVSKEVVRDILDNPASYLNALGGQRTKCALIMTDLRGFTTMSEEMESHQLVKQLNEYLSAMVEDIFAARGSVDKFIGDAILAVWGHLNSSGPKEDVRLALQAVLRMQESLRRLNDEWTKRGLRNFQMGVGLNYGEVVFGNIGSAKKMEPTVIGDTVNVTARLESLTKNYGRDLLVGEAAAELLRDQFRLQFVDRVAVKGKTKPLDLYAVIGPAEQKLEAILEEYLALFAAARNAYRGRDFFEADRQFRRCLELRPDDQLPAVYLERCEIFLRQPPAEDWEGVWIAEHK
ncbi:MAG: CHASE2 domain-containing protein [Chthoniobacterales bacterium]